MCELLLIFWGFEYSKSCLLKKTLPESCLLKKTLPNFSWKDFTRIVQNHVCLERLWQNWQSGHVTPGHVYELLLICVDLSVVNLVWMKRLCQNSPESCLLKRLCQNSLEKTLPESCLLRKTLAKLTVRSRDSRSRVRTFVDLCRFECSKSCVLEKTLAKFSWKDFTRIL